jgi:1,4-dihydroxy-2-naphthoate octaprenyltransferase
MTSLRRALRPWLHAIRPRTLPLALASIIMAAFLAAADQAFDPLVILLASLTAICLQILSNLANDYGDFKHGIDHAGRQGPVRVMESGQVTEAAMRRAILLFILLSVNFGLAVVVIGVEPSHWFYFGVIGAAAVGAALTYTMGARPYGYAGLGDLAVLIFFGWAGVLGAYYLQTQRLSWALLLPATSCGLLAVGVLNVNNIRDMNSDRQAGKRSIPVRLGLVRARMYHWLLIVSAAGAALTYVLITGPRVPQLLFVIVLPLLWRHGQAVTQAQKPQDLNRQLKQLAQITLLFVLSFGIGQVW